MAEKTVKSEQEKVELSSKAKASVKKVLQEKKRGKISLFGEFNIDSSAKYSAKDIASFLINNKDLFISPGQTGRVLVAMKYLDMTDIDYNSIAAITKKFWSIKDSKVEVKTTGKSLASLMNGIKNSSIKLYEKPPRSSGSVGGRSNRTISDEDIDNMFSGLK